MQISDEEGGWFIYEGACKRACIYQLRKGGGGGCGERVCSKREGVLEDRIPYSVDLGYHISSSNTPSLLQYMVDLPQKNTIFCGRNPYSVDFEATLRCVPYLCE